MQQMDEIQLIKGKFFFIGVFLVYSIQFGYISIQVVLRLKLILSLGDLFVIYALFNFFEIFGLLVTILTLGAKINALD